MSVQLAKLADRFGKPLYVIIAVAVIVRLVYFICYLDSPLAGYHRADQQYYRGWAMEIADGDLVGEGGFEQGPLYPYFLGTIYSIFGVNDNVALVIQMAFGVVTCVLVYLCGRRLFNERTAFVAGVVTALYGPLVFYECMIMKSFLSPLLTVTTLYCAIRYGDRFHWAWLFGAGAAIGLACQVRENHVLLMIPVILWVVYHAKKSVAESTPKSAKDADADAVVTAHPAIGKSLGVLIGALVLVMLPATIRNYVVAKELIVVTSGGGEVFYLGNGPHATGYYTAPPFVNASPYQEHEDFREKARELSKNENLSRAQSSRFWFGETVGSIFRNPGGTAWLTIVKTSILFNDFEVPDSQFYEATRDHLQFLYLLPSFGFIVGLGLLGIGVAWKSYSRYQLPILFVLAHVVSVLLFYNFGRFRIGMTPILILFAVHGFFWLADALKKNAQKEQAEASSNRVAVGGLVVVAITILAFLRPLNYSMMTYEFERENLMSRLAIRQQKFALAQQHVKNALNLSTTPYTKAIGYRNLGDMMKLRGNKELAAKQYTSSLEFDPDSAETLYVLGDVLYELGDLDSAVRRLVAAKRNSKQFIPVYISLGGVYLEQGRFRKSEIELRTALKYQPDQAHLHSLMGAALVRQRKYEAGLEHHRRAIKIDPGSAEPYFRYATDLEFAGRFPDTTKTQNSTQRYWSQAIQNYDLAIENDPSFTPAQLSLAKLLFDLATQIEKPISVPPFTMPTKEGVEFMERTVKLYEGIVEREPDNFDGHLGLGFVYAKMSKYYAANKRFAPASQTLQKAPRHFVEARKLRPNDPRSYLRYADMLSETATPEKEAQQREAVLRLPRENINPNIILQTHQRLAQIYMGLDNPKVEAKHLNEMLIIQPKLDPIANRLAWILATSDDDSLRDGRKARSLAFQANEVYDSKNPIYLDTLAAAQIENAPLLEAEAKELAKAADQAEANGDDDAKEKRALADARQKAADDDYQAAIDNGKKALEILKNTPEPTEQGKQLIKSLEKRIELYEKRQPYHGKIR